MGKRADPLKPVLPAVEEALAPDLAQRLDPICDAFEAAWRMAPLCFLCFLLLDWNES